MTKANSVLVFDSNIRNPFITIAIPTYKRGDLLDEAIHSVLNQDKEGVQYEILVVDNNPERNDITEKLMEKYNDVKEIAYYKNEENLGMTGNWNRLYDLAKGDYVVMLHDDDMIMPYYLRVTTALLKQTKCRYELIYPGFYYSKGREMPDLKVPPKLQYKVMKKEDYLTTQWGLPTGLMICKEEFRKTGGFKEDYYPIHDQEFIYRALHFVRGVVVRYPICFYYQGVNTSMNPQVIVEGIVKVNMFNKLISEDKTNNLRWFAKICKRNQIANIVSWSSNFATGEVIDAALKSINVNKSKLKDNFSFLVANLLKLRYLFRIHSFCVDKIDNLK